MDIWYICSVLSLCVLSTNGLLWIQYFDFYIPINGLRSALVYSTDVDAANESHHLLC